jgi:hypothetical protein
MRILDFIVTDQKIEKDPACDFTNLVAGTVGYVRASFYFNRTWDGFGKVAVFTYRHKDYPVIIDDDYCDIPNEVLIGSKFSVKVVGLKNGVTIPTNSVAVYQTRR